MLNGDLASSDHPVNVIILEGVLAKITTIVPAKKRFSRKDEPLVAHIKFFDTPLKRMVHMREYYPGVGLEIVTFINEDVAEVAAKMLLDTTVPFDSVTYQDFDDWVSILKFKKHIQAIYDSDERRLQQYGQLGVGRVLGGDL